MSRQLISMRTHVVSLVAVFLALAIGIALGGGPLGGSASSDARDDDGDDEAQVAAAPTTGVDPAYADAFAAAGAARLYADGLSGHASAILAFPGADAAQVKAVSAQVLAAGGALTGTYELGADVLDPEAEADLDETTGQIATALADVRVDPTAPTYERAGQLLALAMATDQLSSTRADPAAVTVRQALGEAGLLTSPNDVRMAPLVLVVLPPGTEGGRDGTGLQALLGGLVNGLAGYATGVVVAGDAESADSGGLAALRAGELVGPVATVDGLQSAIGQVSTVLALISVVGGTGGSFGESGADGAVPVP